MKLTAPIVVAMMLAIASPLPAAPCFGTADGSDPRWNAAAARYTPAPGATWARNAITFTDVHGRPVTRWYWRFVPVTAPASGRTLVVALHGGSAGFRPGADPESAAWGFNALAQPRGWVVLYPEGSFDPAELDCASGLVSRSWNDGRYFGSDQDEVWANAEDVDDVGFVAALIDAQVATQAVDPGRVYAVGTSNGGLMVQRLVGEPRTAFRFAAVATNLATLPSAGADFDQPAFTPLAPIDGLHLFGEIDRFIPATGGRIGAGPARLATIGGCSDGAPQSCDIGLPVADFPGRGYGTSRATFIAAWEGANGVSSYAIDALPDVDGDGLLMQRGRSSNAGRLADLHLYEMQGGGHRNWGQSSSGALGPVCISRPDCGAGALFKTELATSTFDVCWVELVTDFFATH